MAEPAQRRDDGEGGKFYEHPTRTALDGTPRQYISVTTALSVVAKPALLYWATKLSARRAMDNLPRLMVAAMGMAGEPCGRTYNRSGDPRCGTCGPCTQRWVEIFHVGEKMRRAREGSAVHDVIEWWSKTGEIRYDPSEHLYEYEGGTHQVTWEQIQPYLDRFEQWVADYGIAPGSFVTCEATVWHHDDGWAGTLDAILKVAPVTAKAAKLCARVHAANGRVGGQLDAPVLLVLDNKSREGEDKAFYPEYSLQSGGAYRHGQTMTAKLGAFEVDMPATHGAAILQMRPDGYNFEPVSSGQREYRAFLAALDLYRWHADHGQASIQVGTFPVPAGWKWEPPAPAQSATFTRARTPDGELCGCPACDDPHDPGCMFGGLREPGVHVREVTVDDDPVEPPKPAKAAKRAAPAKRTSAAAKKAAAAAADRTPATPPPPGTSATLDSMRRAAPSGIPDDGIPF